MTGRLPLALALALAAARGAEAASFDIATEYRMRALSYTNANISDGSRTSVVSQRARLGFALKNIQLSELGGESQSMDIHLRLHGLGVAGSTATLQGPLARAADNYPSTDFTPFLEHAYLDVHHLGGWPWKVSFGRQPFRLGGGLLLDDDGAGLTGIVGRGTLPWKGIKAEGFILQADNLQSGGPSNQDFLGFTLDAQGEGNWQFHQLLEKDRSAAVLPLNGCPGGCQVSKATRWFTGVRYHIAYGPMIFDGEAALQKGSAVPSGPTPAPNHITFNGNAQVFRTKWKQSFGRGTQGIARLSIARGSGDDPATPTTDEAFFPSHGHRFDGLERSGFGDFFGATPYDAFGQSTPNGLRAGASGLWVFGLGATPPAWKGIVLDLDHYLFQADRNLGPHRTLGTELDLRLRYDIFDRFSVSAGAAFFTVGPASNPAKGSARRLTFEASGRF